MTPLSLLVTSRLGRILWPLGQQTFSRESFVGSNDKLTNLSNGSILHTRLVALAKLVEDAALAVEGWRVGINSVVDAGQKLVETLNKPLPPPYYRRNYGRKRS